MAVGRLDQTEFDERLTAALSARTVSDLNPLFSDLPGPRPGQEVAIATPFTPPPWQASNAAAPATTPSAGAQPTAPSGISGSLLAAITAVIWPVTILAITFGFGWENAWWLVFVPIIVTSALGKNRSHQARERARIERDQRHLDRRRRQLGD